MRNVAKAAFAAMGMLVGAPAGAQGLTTVSPNQGLSPAETVWHLRAGLNVAALGCRGPGEAATVAGYNALLASEKAALAEALAAVAATYKARHGTQWQARFDDAMTRLYNYWAQPAAHDGFCAEAEAVLRDAATVEPAAFQAFAATALPRLDTAFARAGDGVAGTGDAPVLIVALVEEPPVAPVDAGALPPTVIARVTPVSTAPVLP